MGKKIKRQKRTKAKFYANRLTAHGPPGASAEDAQPHAISIITEITGNLGEESSPKDLLPVVIGISCLFPWHPIFALPSYPPNLPFLPLLLFSPFSGPFLFLLRTLLLQNCFARSSLRSRYHPSVPPERGLRNPRRCIYIITHRLRSFVDSDTRGSSRIPRAVAGLPRSPPPWSARCPVHEPSSLVRVPTPNVMRAHSCVSVELLTGSP